ncbi:hypothetical protein [Streptomyces sp. NPDC093111]|uniref:hypothetical protein n=1 Tax=Streptomyces sp. NPDC093111 TaxID=3154978 RepID=UPI00341451B8
MSAHAIPGRSLLLAFAVTTALAWTAAGRRRGSLAIAAGLTSVQGALHLIFGAGEHGPMSEPRGSTGSMSELGSMGSTGAMEHVGSMSAVEHMGSMSAMEHMDSMASMGSMAHAMTMGGAGAPGHGVGPGSDLGMLAAHLFAALACGLWLAHGEAALFALARAVAATAFTPLRLALAAVRALAPVPPALRPVRTAPYPRRPRGVVLARSVSRRGPPRPAVPRATALGARV